MSLFRHALKRLFSGALENNKALFSNLKGLNNELKIVVITKLVKGECNF